MRGRRVVGAINNGDVEIVASCQPIRFAMCWCDASKWCGYVAFDDLTLGDELVSGSLLKVLATRGPKAQMVLLNLLSFLCFLWRA